MTGNPPKVFISYSHDTVQHQERVLGLADRLRGDGIDAEIDQYNASPPEGWPLWCERQIEAADFVLMVCTETYHRRVKGDEQPGHGRGVVWEAGIIRQILYDAGAVGDKFVPVLFSDGSPEQIPRPIKGSSWHVVDREDGYESLLRRLTQQPAFARPALGAMRALPARPRQWSDARMAPPPVPPAAGSSLPPGGPTVAARARDQGERAMGDKNIHVGGNMIGSAAVTGDHNVTTVTYRKVTLPPADSIDIRSRAGGAQGPADRPRHRGSTEDRQCARRGGERRGEAAPRQERDRRSAGAGAGLRRQGGRFRGEGRQDRCTRAERRRLARRPLAQAVAAGRPHRLGASAMDERNVTIGQDALGNAIVTGSNNLTVVLFGVDQIPADLIDALKSGRMRPADAPGAVPLPALTLAIEFADEGRTQWRITARRATGASVSRTEAVPWQSDAAFDRRSRPSGGCRGPRRRRPRIPSGWMRRRTGSATLWRAR